MRNTVLSYLLYPLFAISLSLNAAPAASSKVSDIETGVVVGAESKDSRLDLNKADADALQSHLNGIGKAKAQAIVEYRQAHGAFTSVDELLEVKGIGSALIERNRERLTVE